jgi:large subunit ribosomal protein L29
MKMSEIKDLSDTELDKKFRELGEELLQLQIRKQTGQVEKPHLIKSIRRDRAKILTTLSVSKNETA